MLVSDYLDWRKNSLQCGFSFSNPPIWWNKLIQYHRQPLVVSFPKHASYLFKKGVKKIYDIWDFNSINQSCGKYFKDSFKINNKIEGFLVFVKSLVLMELIMKLCTPLQFSVFKDLLWLDKYPFSFFASKKYIFLDSSNFKVKSIT